MVGEPIEIGKHGCDELLPAPISRRQRTSKEIEKIASLLRRLVPIRGRCSENTLIKQTLGWEPVVRLHDGSEQS